MTRILQKHLIPVLVVITTAIVLTGCLQTEAPLQHEVQVQDAATGNPVAGANVMAKINLRYQPESTTNSEGVALLSFDSQYLELHAWTKITVEAEGHPTQSVLVQLQEGGAPTVVKLGASATTAARPAGNSDQEATGETTNVEAEQGEVSSVSDETDTIPDQATTSNAPPPPGPLAEIPAADRADFYTSRPEMSIETGHIYQATLQTSKGDIVLSLDAAAAPEHVNNFIFLSKEGFYNGLTFHRVEPGFVIQGGDPLGSGQGGPGYTIPGEFSLKHGAGALAMARLPDTVNPDRESSGSQFYITLEPTPFLDNEYSVFGNVTEGMDVVKAIEVGDTIERIIIEP